jgi:hypothetical protein
LLLRLRAPHLVAHERLRADPDAHPPQPLHHWDVRTGARRAGASFRLRAHGVDADAAHVVYAATGGLWAAPARDAFTDPPDEARWWARARCLRPEDAGLRTPDARRAAAKKVTLSSDFVSPVQVARGAAGAYSALEAARRARATRGSYMFAMMMLNPAPPVPASARALVAYQPPVMPTFRSGMCDGPVFLVVAHAPHAVRISPCGAHLAAYTDEQLLYVVWDFADVVCGRAAFEARATSYDMSVCGKLLQMEWARVGTRLVVHAVRCSSPRPSVFHRPLRVCSATGELRVRAAVRRGAPRERRAPPRSLFVACPGRVRARRARVCGRSGGHVRRDMGAARGARCRAGAALGRAGGDANR